MKLLVKVSQGPCTAEGDFSESSDQLHNSTSIGHFHLDTSHIFDLSVNCLTWRPITTRLKNLLKERANPLFSHHRARMVSLLLELYLFGQDYPADISMFKEMVQNADDAGATEAGMA